MVRLESILDKTYEFIDAARSEDPEDFKHHEATLRSERPKQNDVKMKDVPLVKECRAIKET